MKRLGHASVVAVVLLTLVACEGVLTRPDPRKNKGLDRKLDAFTYIEEGKLLAFAVGTQATRYREKEPYIPLAIGVANKSAPTLHITRESFLLYDESGKQYPMAPYSEINERYHRNDADKTFTSFFEIWNGKWPTYNLVDSSFFPIRTASVVQDFVELPKFHYFMEYLYFPQPESGLLDHRFELHMKAQGLEEPVFVKFRVD